jgi:hypothetical protein
MTSHTKAPLHLSFFVIWLCAPPRVQPQPAAASLRHSPNNVRYNSISRLSPSHIRERFPPSQSDRFSRYV